VQEVCLTCEIWKDRIMNGVHGKKETHAVGAIYTINVIDGENIATTSTTANRMWTISNIPREGDTVNH